MCIKWSNIIILIPHTYTHRLRLQEVLVEHEIGTASGHMSNLTSMTPVIMFGACTAQICLYDCVQDILLLSDVFEWMAYDDKDDPCIVNGGLSIIWMTIHHR